MSRRHAHVNTQWCFKKCCFFCFVLILLQNYCNTKSIDFRCCSITYEYIYRVIMNYCTIVVGLGERWWLNWMCPSLITWVRLASPIGGATSGSGNLSTSLSNVAKQAAHPKFVWIFNANCDGTIIYK
jgi:hypothetical protein